MNKEIKDYIKNIEMLFPNAFISLKYELILEPKNNIYFRLEDIETEIDFKCKMIVWVSRPSCKGVSEYWQRKFLKGLNGFLGTDFSKDQMRKIYTRLGNDVNRKLCEEFIKSNYNFSVIY